MGVLSEIKNRGTEDILIACMDGLAGFPEALEDFGKKKDEKCPMIKAAWQRNWNELSEFFNYPPRNPKSCLYYECD